MTTKIQTALRLALKAKRFRDLAGIEVHRTRRGHWQPPAVPCTRRCPMGDPRAALASGRHLQRAAGLAWPAAPSRARALAGAQLTALQHPKPPAGSPPAAGSRADRAGRAVAGTRRAPSLKPHLLKGEQSMNTRDYVAAVLANAEAGGIHNAELAALRSRLRQLADPQAVLLPGKVLQPVADLPRLDELPEPPPDRGPCRARPAGGREG